MEELKQGEGEEETFDEMVFRGGFDKGKKNGNGTLVFKDGTHYTGQFKDDKMEVSGFLRQGYGVFTWIVKEEGQEEGAQPKVNVYEGFFKNNLLSGKGIYRWADKRVYEGEFLEDKRHGFGIMRYANGDIYEGKWENGQRHGHGCFIQKDGQKYYGKFENNKLVQPLKQVIKKPAG